MISLLGHYWALVRNLLLELLIISVYGVRLLLSSHGGGVAKARSILSLDSLLINKQKKKKDSFCHHNEFYTRSSIEWALFRLKFYILFWVSAWNLVSLLLSGLFCDVYGFSGQTIYSYLKVKSKLFCDSYLESNYCLSTMIVCKTKSFYNVLFSLGY